MGNASQINRSRNSVRVERRSDLNESDLGEVYCISIYPVLVITYTFADHFCIKKNVLAVPHDTGNYMFDIVNGINIHVFVLTWPMYSG